MAVGGKTEVGRRVLVTVSVIRFLNMVIVWWLLVA